MAAACRERLGRARRFAGERSAADEPGWSVSYGGELRERFESSDHPLFGLSAPAHNDYLLNRLYLSADLQDGRRFRLRVEGVSATTSGWQGTPPPTQEDPADVLQAFAEGTFEANGGQLQLRAGRQELKLGSSRLVSVRESPNVRRAFDGVRATWSVGSRRLDAFFVRPVSPESGNFDDQSSSAQQFWGLYATTDVPALGDLAVDAYYLGLGRQDALFALGRENELRHTIGARLFGNLERFDLNLEGAWQWGSFGSDRIRAWTLSADIGYSLQSLPGSPRFGLKADAISGDRDSGDRTLGTFNPLFPRLPYFSEANIATPANLLDVQPSLSITLPHDVTATLSWNGLWKYAKADAFYAPPLTPVPGTIATATSYIGDQVSVLAEWQANAHLNLAASYVYFEPGAFVREAGGRSGSFGAAWAQFRF